MAGSETCYGESCRGHYKGLPGEEVHEGAVVRAGGRHTMDLAFGRNGQGGIRHLVECLERFYEQKAVRVAMMNALAGQVDHKTTDPTA